MRAAVFLTFFPVVLVGQSCSQLRLARPVEGVAVRTPGSWAAVSQGSGGRISTGWLDRLGNAELTRTVNEAVATNRGLKVAAARFREARQSTIISRARSRPELNLNGSGSLRDAPGEASSKDYGLNLAASWEVDLWGRLNDLNEAADATEQAALEDYRGARLSLAANTAKAWCNLISASQELGLAEVTLESFQKNLRIIERNYLGTGEGALDIQFGRTNVSSAQRSLEQRKQDREEAARALEILLSRYPSGTARAGRELPRLQSRVPAGLPSQLLDRRPDLAAAQAELLASARQADAARKDLLPSFSLTGNAGSSSITLTDFLDAERLASSIAGRFSQVISRGGAVKAEAQAALARNDAALNRYVEAALNAFREVESTLSADRSLAAQETFLASELEQAALAERQAERDYSEGVNPNILSVLEAQRRANNARASMIRLRNQRLQNRIDLHLALGGDFSTNAAVPVSN